MQTNTEEISRVVNAAILFYSKRYRHRSKGNLFRVHLLLLSSQPSQFSSIMPCWHSLFHHIPTACQLLPSPIPPPSESQNLISNLFTLRYKCGRVDLGDGLYKTLGI